MADYLSLGIFIKNVIATVEENPYYQFVINYPVTYEFANQIKAVVNDYYGVPTNSGLGTYIMPRASSLQYSTKHGDWLDEYHGYNCYSYAIGQTRPFDGYIVRHYPGCFNTSTYLEFSLDMTVGEMAELTVSDLESLEHPCVIAGTSYSEIMTFLDTHTIICLRKCSTPGYEDFHYMKLSGSDWLHKPGLTHVLKLNTLPGESVWFNEGIIDGVLQNGDRYYTGTIYYFAFRSNHDLTSAGATGEHYHQGSLHYYQYRNVCDDCGDVVYTWESVPCSGPPCSSQIMGLPNEETQ